MLMSNNKDFIELARSYRDWGRPLINENDIKERYNFDIDGIKYDGKYPQHQRQ